MCLHKTLWGNSQENRPGKWRLIVNLSAPDGHSVNDFIEKEVSTTLTYFSINNIAQVVLQFRKGTLLGKMDVKEAFRLVPVTPQTDYSLVWYGKGAQPSLVYSSC